MFLAPKPVTRSEIPSHRRQLSVDVSSLSESQPIVTSAVNRVAEPIFNQAGHQLFGLDAELELKRREKHDPEYDRKAILWLGEVTEETVDADNIWETLKSGVILCKLANKIVPNTLKPDSRAIPLVERENIAKYLAFCGQWGVESNSLFVISDLYEKKGLEQVITNIYAMSKIYERMSGFKGPTLSAKPVGVPKSRSMIVRPVSTEDLPDKKPSDSSPLREGGSAIDVSPSKREAFASRLRDKFFKDSDVPPTTTTSTTPSTTTTSATGSPVLPRGTTILVTRPVSEKEDLQKRKEEVKEKLRIKEEQKKATLERRNSKPSLLTDFKKKKDTTTSKQEGEDEEDDEDADSDSSSDDKKGGKKTGSRLRGSSGGSEGGKGKLAFIAEFVALQREQLQKEMQERQEKLAKAEEEFRQQLQQQQPQHHETGMLSQGLLFMLLFALIRIGELALPLLPFFTFDPQTREAFASLGNDTLAIGVILVVLGQLSSTSTSSTSSSNSSSSSSLMSLKALSSSVLVLTYGLGLMARFALPPSFANVFLLLFWGTALLVVLFAFMTAFSARSEKGTKPQ